MVGIRLKPRDALNGFVGALIGLSVFYMIAFPKGGVKIYGIPLTIGYALSGLLLVISILSIRFRSISFKRIICVLPCLILGLWSWVTISTNGYVSTAFVAAYFVTILYIPLFGLTAFSGLIMDNHRRVVERSILIAVRFIVFYGIFLFIFKYMTGKWIEIPYFTINADDMGQLDEKMVNRGGIFKLISTYNNGNIFGVSLSIMAPYYFRIENRKAFLLALFLALALTLSRTVWISAIILALFFSLSGESKIKAAASMVGSLTLLLLGLVATIAFMGRDLAFVFDSNLGGRASQLTRLGDAQWASVVPYFSITEIIYASFVQYFGYGGLIIIIFYLFTPIFLLYLGGTSLLSKKFDTACLQGLVTYVIIAASDGAFVYIPVMMIFWMIAGLGLWYQRLERLR